MTTGQAEPRDFPTRPWVGVGVVIFKDDKVLLVRRAKPPRAGSWSIPGGMQELGETAAQAGIREVCEETGITVAIDGLIDIIDVIVPEDDGRIRTHYTLIDYHAHWLAGEPQAADDVSDARWVPLDKLTDYGIWSETLRVINESATARGLLPPAAEQAVHTPLTGN